MPTGGGKSLCYQIPALLFDGLTVVVSPLIALMKDQVEQMRAAGVPALFLNSTLSPEAYSDNMDCVRRGQAKLLYLAPETLLTPRILGLLAELKVDCLALTATPRVRADIIRSLGLQGSNEFVASFNRENLFIEVAPKRDGAAQLTRFLERFKEQSGIIYCFSRRQVDELSEGLIVRLFEVVLRQCVETVLYGEAMGEGKV